MEVYNFSAGPARLPKEVMQIAQEEFCNYQNSGSGIVELSHRGKYFAPVMERAQANIRELMNISDDYEVFAAEILFRCFINICLEYIPVDERNVSCIPESVFKHFHEARVELYAYDSLCGIRDTPG